MTGPNSPIWRLNRCGRLPFVRESGDNLVRLDVSVLTVAAHPGEVGVRGDLPIGLLGGLPGHDLFDGALIKPATSGHGEMVAVEEQRKRTRKRTTRALRWRSRRSAGAGTGIGRNHARRAALRLSHEAHQRRGRGGKHAGGGRGPGQGGTVGPRASSRTWARPDDEVSQAPFRGSMPRNQDGFPQPGGRKLFPSHRVLGWHRSGGLPAWTQLLLAGTIVGGLVGTRCPCGHARVGASPSRAISESEEGGRR